MKKYAFSMAVALLALAFSHPTAFHSYVSFKGSKQGQLKGESTKKKGREADGWFNVISFDMGTELPVDAKSGAPSGARRHSPVVITKENDAASPALQNAHYTNEVFESVVIQTLDDQNKVAKTIKLKNAVIADIKKNGTNETVSFTYEQAEVQ